jgi:hypothetical protein
MPGQLRWPSIKEDTFGKKFLKSGVKTNSLGTSSLRQALREIELIENTKPRR